MVSIKKQIVVGYHPIANRIGEKILNSGGNAFDAFVATTFVEFVSGEGATSLAGPLGALLYNSKSKKVHYLDAGFNTPISHKKRKDKTGARVPGAPAGLEEISKKFGKLPFEAVIKPAIKLAHRGFKLNSLYADLISINKAKLKKTEYGRKNFFQNSKPLAKGDVLKVSEVAKVLESLAKEGSKYMYEGEWAKKMIKINNDNGGILTSKDFENYQVFWKKPMKVNYKGYDIYTNFGRTFGGISSIMALKTLENFDIKTFSRHYVENTDALELFLKISNEADRIIENYSLEN